MRRSKNRIKNGRKNSLRSSIKFVGRKAPRWRSPASTGTVMKKACTAVPVAEMSYSAPTPSLTPAPVGQVSGRQYPKKTSIPKRTTAFSCAGPKLCAVNAMLIWGMYFPTDRRRPICVTASTRRLSSSIRRNRIRTGNPLWLPIGTTGTGACPYGLPTFDYGRKSISGSGLRPPLSWLRCR